MIPEFEVTILGNTSSIPVHGRHHTAQVVRFGQDFLLLDCGEAMQLQARAFKIRVSKINTIFISHLHGDHYLGLVGLLSSYHLAKRTSPLTLFGPQGLDEIITTHFRWSNTKLSYPLTFVQTHDDGLNLLLDTPRYQVYSFPLKHRLPTTGFLIKEKHGLRSMIKEKLQQDNLSFAAIQSLRKGIDYKDENGKKYKVNAYTHPLPPLRSYAYCSDTIYNPDLKPYLENVDLLYHESTFMEDNRERAAVTFHSTAKQAAEIAKISGVKKLLLGHFSSRYTDLELMLGEAKSVFPSSILSEEGQTYAI
ncbi:ribonuclease Z [Algoriphagus sp. 4150]|uniref:ribonuclease Z n=1 Tax=Algoriphagus sp. 4150 TaxID=2817756 RepID=UPI00286C14AE|nr:ribonuclease Z [Algoriphagus sp. 4150]